MKSTRNTSRKPAPKAANPNDPVPFSTTVPRWVRDTIDKKRGLAKPAAMGRYILTTWAQQNPAA